MLLSLSKHLRVQKQARGFLGAGCTGRFNSAEANSEKQAAALSVCQVLCSELQTPCQLLLSLKNHSSKGSLHPVG